MSRKAPWTLTVAADRNVSLDTELGQGRCGPDLARLAEDLAAASEEVYERAVQQAARSVHPVRYSLLDPGTPGHVVQVVAETSRDRVRVLYGTAAVGTDVHLVLQTAAACLARAARHVDASRLATAA